MSEPKDPLDNLIAQLEQAVADISLADFLASPALPPRSGIVTLERNAYTGRESLQPMPIQVYSIKDGLCTFQSQDTLVRGQNLKLEIRMVRDAHGDTILAASGTVTKVAKIPGRYAIQVQMNEMERTVEPVQRIFMQYAQQGDFAPWNRWSEELKEGVSLRGMVLTGMKLAYFDLCGADLTGCNLRNANLTEANLAGANLTGCNLAGTTFDGADLFGATIPRKFMGVLYSAGLIELESILFSET